MLRFWIWPKECPRDINPPSSADLVGKSPSIRESVIRDRTTWDQRQVQLCQTGEEKDKNERGRLAEQRGGSREVGFLFLGESVSMAFEFVTVV